MGDLERYGASEDVFREAAKYPKFTLGRVLTQSKRMFRIVTDDGEFLAEVNGKFRHAATSVSDYPVVGDYVLAMTSRSTGKAVIHYVLTRRNAFERTIAGKAQRAQVVAANIDIVFICMSLNANYSLNRMERYLTVAWKSGARPVVLLTKGDVASVDVTKCIEDVKGIARKAEVFATSMFDESSVALLHSLVPKGVTAAFIGSSGVGKSTLVNLLLGEERQATQAIRETDDKGRHTTSMREMIALPNGGVVIDTPGMRELGIETADIETAFADIEQLALECRFSDCRHETEPDCAVKQAVADGRLDARRLESYLKLRAETERR